MEEKITPITTTIPMSIYKDVVAKRWKHNEIYLLGYKAKNENPQLLNRMQELEKKMEKSETDRIFYRKRYAELMAKIESDGDETK